MGKITRKRYSKQELIEAKRTGDSVVFADLAGKMLLGKADDFSLAEAELAASVLRSSKLEGSICFVDLASIPGAQNYRFKQLYLSYSGDLDGRYGIEKFTGLVSLDEKKEDVIRLNEYFEQWRRVVSSNRHKDQLLNAIVNEINNDRRTIVKLHQTHQITTEDFLYKEKSIVLHSKYLYLTARAFFEEHGSLEVVALHHGRKIIINEYSLIHILNRHFAECIKQFDTRKSFHQDAELNWFEMPYELRDLLEQIGGHPATAQEDLGYIPFRYNGKIYAIWTEQIPRGRENTFTRMQTCYPIERADKLQELEDRYVEIQIDTILNAFVKK